MKIRNGFVSNSSSASFIIISKENLDAAPLMHANEDDSWLEVEADDKTCYNRGNNCRLDTLCDKLKYLTILYACHYQRSPRYFFLMDNLRNKFQKLWGLNRKDSRSVVSSASISSTTSDT